MSLFFYSGTGTFKDPNQLELELVQFFPLTEQIPLNFSFEGCDTRNNYVTTINTEGTTWTTVATNIIPQAQLTVTPINSVGEIYIGGIRVGLEKKPSWIQRKLHRLLGFNWKDRE